jgi:hypothetical protein
MSQTTFFQSILPAEQTFAESLAVLLGRHLDAVSQDQYYESKLGTNHELNRVVLCLLNPAHCACSFASCQHYDNDQAFRDFSIDVRHRFTCTKQFAHPQSPRENCRRSFGIETKGLLIQEVMPVVFS